MAKIACFAVAVALINCLNCWRGEAAGLGRRRTQREGATIEDIPWGSVNYTFYTNEDVFLLKDISGPDAASVVDQNNSYLEGLYAEQIVGTAGMERTLFKAGSGPFWVQKELYRVPSEPFGNLNIQARLLENEILPFAASISVLFSIRDEAPFHSGQDRSSSSSVRPCLRAVATFSGEESASACSPQGDSDYCVTKIPVLISWQERSRLTDVDKIRVSYTIFPATSTGECEPDHGNSISQDGITMESNHQAIECDVGKVTLLSWDGNLDIVNQDKYVELYIPTRRLGVHERFVIPVTINRMYLDGDCTVKAKAKNGITAVAVRSTNQDKWNTLSMVKQKGTFAMVTAAGLKSPDFTGTESPEETPLVFMVEFEVLNDTSASRIINWRVDCNLRGEAHASRFGTDIPVTDSWIEAIVPLPREKSITNTALITGHEVTVPLDILVVTHLGDVMDDAGLARCRSPDLNILKVRRSCTSVYLDGTETAGTESIDIEVSLQGHDASMTFSVWVPEFPLRVELSDGKLSMIRGWKVATGRHDAGIPEPEEMLNGDGDSEKKSGCRLRYQQTKVGVYTRFYTPNANSMSRPDGKRIYLFGENMEQSITHLVKDQIVVLDRSIAKVEGTKVIARTPGSTKVQILYPGTREILGESVLAVAADKVDVADLKVTLVSGMTLNVDDVGPGSRVKLASIAALGDLFVEHQEAVLDAVFIFDDGTNLALQDVNTNDYTIAITTLNPEVVLESPDSIQSYPGLITMGEGSTSVMLEVALPTPCMKRRRSNAISFNVIPVNVSYSNPKYTDVVNINKDVGSAESLWRSLSSSPGVTDYGIVRTNFDLTDLGVKKGSSVISSIPIDTVFDNNFPVGPDGNPDGNAEEPSQPPSNGGSSDNQYSSSAERLSGLEIGMYVLLAVFCLAIIAFMINCVLFMARYRKAKRVPKVHHGSSYPQNWVLFGMHEDNPRITLDPAENVPLRNKDEEGSSRDEAIGTESEVSIERHSSVEGPGEGCNVKETSLTQDAPLNQGNSDSQELDCGVVLDCDDMDDMSVEGEQTDGHKVSDTKTAEEGCSNIDDAIVETSDQVAAPTAEAVVAPADSNTNQSNSCDMRITLNPSDNNEHLKSGLEGMEFNQLLDYLENLKESCT